MEMEMDDIPEGLDPIEEKRLKRMRRNRESAAMSRNQKKMYIEELETKVANLAHTIGLLRSENWSLKEENAALRAQAGLEPRDPSLNVESGLSGAEETSLEAELKQHPISA